MTVGKYSPTVSSAYRADQGWHERNGGGNKKNWTDPYDGRDYDNDGYDSYGYNSDNTDRAGNHENDYMMGEWINDEYSYPLYDNAFWGVDENGFPKELK